MHQHYGEPQRVWRDGRGVPGARQRRGSCARAVADENGALHLQAPRGATYKSIVMRTDTRVFGYSATVLYWNYIEFIVACTIYLFFVFFCVCVFFIDGSNLVSPRFVIDCVTESVRTLYYR